MYLVFLSQIVPGSLNISNLSSFYTDDEAAAYKVGSYFIKKGHKKIGVVGGILSATQISSLRYAGCIRSFQENNIPFDEKKRLCAMSIFYGGRISGNEKTFKEYAGCYGSHCTE